MSEYTLSNGRQIVSEVLLKLEPSVLPKLPMACKACPDAVWQTTGKTTDKVQVRCFCPVLHVFTWSPTNQEEILDCEHLYQTQDEDEPEGAPNLDDLPPFLRAQREESGGLPPVPPHLESLDHLEFEPEE